MKLRLNLGNIQNNKIFYNISMNFSWNISRDSWDISRNNLGNIQNKKNFL